MSDAVDAATPLRRPARPRVFYGWWIVLGAVVAQFVAVGMQSSVGGVFLRPMSEDLGWTRAQFTIATSVGTGVSGLIGFFVGGYVDRIGARPLMVVGATIVGGALMAISRVEELWQFVLLRGLVFTVGFVLIGNLVVNVTVSKWFVERRGWAISMASLGVSAAGIAMPVVMVRVVDSLGWRDAWMVMGVAAWVLVYPVALIMRRQPEDHGLLPDGKLAGVAEDAKAVEAARLDYVNSYTRGQAVRTPAMWLLVVAFGFALVGLISLLFHSIPFLTDSGFSRGQASLMVGSQGAAALLSKFWWGWLMQRMHPRGLAALSFVLSGGAVLAMVPIAHSGSLPLMFAAFVIWGWGIGGMIPLSEFIWASFFGRRHLGAVRSAAMPVTILFSAGGPFVFGLWFDLVGSYDGALTTVAALWMIGAVVVLLARQPAPKAATPLGASAPPSAAPPPAPAAVQREPAAATQRDDAGAVIAARRAPLRPRSYMGDGNGARPVRDYMHAQLPEQAATREPEIATAPPPPAPTLPPRPAARARPPAAEPGVDGGPVDEPAWAFVPFHDRPAGAGDTADTATDGPSAGALYAGFTPFREAAANPGEA